MRVVKNLGPWNNVKVIYSLVAQKILNKFKVLTLQQFEVVLFRGQCADLTALYSWQKGKDFYLILGVSHYYILKQWEIPNILVPNLSK